MGLILKIVGIFSIIIGIVAVFTIIGTGTGITAIIQGIVLIAVGSIYDDVKYIKYFLKHK
jgi:uncharacterized membrane protein HdeD (DUF308 family)